MQIYAPFPSGRLLWAGSAGERCTEGGAFGCMLILCITLGFLCWVVASDGAYVFSAGDGYFCPPWPCFGLVCSS